MFDISQSFCDEHGENDESLAQDYIEGLMQEFADAPEAKTVLAAHGGIGWAATMMEFGVNYLGLTPANMSPADLNEILFELFPRKLSTEAENAPGIIAELRAFWAFVNRQYGLPAAEEMMQTVLDDDAERQLEEALSDPSNFGMAKSMFMLGNTSGFDMTTQEGLDQFTLAYNSKLLGQRMAALPTRLGADKLMPWPKPAVSRDERERKRKKRKQERQARRRNRR